MKKYKMVLTIIFAVHFLIFSLLLSCAYRIFGYQDMNKTSEYSATISNVQVTGSGENVKINIFTQEYSSYLTILFENIGSRINVSEITALKSGDCIKFRVSESMQTLINVGGFVEIVSLETKNGTVFSIEQYNEYMYEDMKPDLLSSTVMTGIMFFLALGFGLSMIKDKRKTADNSLS